MTTPDQSRDALAYALYLAWQRGAGRYATGAPYPTHPWSALRDCQQEQYRLRADRFRQKAHLAPAHRLYLSWSEDRYVKPFDRVNAGVRVLWWTVAEELAALVAEREAA